MAPQTTRLLLPDELEDVGKTSDLAATDRDALRAVSAWIKDFVAKPHKDLGRAGTVCPFVPGSLERRMLWLAPEKIAEVDAPAVVELMDDYKRLFLEKAPLDDEDAIYKTIIVVFTDLPAERAGALFADVLGQLADASYEEDGIIFGPFYDGNEGTAIYNSSFRPFQSPVPFLFVRHTVLSDWKFFVDDDALLDRWARRFGPAGTAALAQELRRLPWRVARQ
jgi:Domain of unknown function (DUF6875)